MLPRIDTPVYELKLPASGKEVRFRPFLVKEQRNLLMAMEATDYETIERNIKQILINCTISESIDFDELPIVDVEYYFLNLRARSVGEVVELKYICNNEISEGVECGNTMQTSINVLDVQVKNINPNGNVINITDEIMVALRYPKFSVIKKFDEELDMMDLAVKMIADSIEYVYDGQQYYYANETPREELISFIESLNQQQFSKLEKFFEDIPTIKENIKIKCSKCGFEHDIVVEGLEDFFV